MGTLTGQNIVTRALYKANDESGAHWTAAESLLLVNDAQRAVVSRLPKAGATSGMPSLVASSSRQTLTGLSLTRGIEWLDVVCNVSGTTRGAPIRKTSRAWLDDEVAGWHVATGDAVEYWCHDERDPTAIYIYPQVASGTPKIEAIYVAPPADLGTIGTAIGLDDIYAEAMEWFLLFSYYNKDITRLKGAGYANTYYQLFLSALGIREKSIIDNAMLKDMKERGQ